MANATEPIAEALGGHGEYVERPEDIRPALERASALVYRCAKQQSEPGDKRGGKANHITLTPLELIERIAALVLARTIIQKMLHISRPNTTTITGFLVRFREFILTVDLNRCQTMRTRTLRIRSLQLTLANLTVATSTRPNLLP